MFVKVSGFYAISAIVVVTLLRAEPSPLKADAVTALVTFKLFKVASEPLTISFFQFGITLVITVGYRTACPLPIRAYNIPINSKKLDYSTFVFLLKF